MLTIQLNVAKQVCVVVGGGQVAERKIAHLLSSGATQLTVVSPAVTDTIATWHRERRLTLIVERYAPHHLHGATLVFVATNDATLNKQVAEQAEAGGALVNRADEADQGDFIVPLTVQRGDLTIAVSTGGASPAFARLLATQLQAQYDERYDVAVRTLGQLRETVKSNRAMSPAVRRQILTTAAHHLAHHLMEKATFSEEEAAQWLHQVQNTGELKE